MAKAKQVRVYASYPLALYLYNSKYEKLISECAEKCKLEEYGSGAGFGVRDRDFGGSRKNAESFSKKLAKYKDINISICDEEE